MAELEAWYENVDLDLPWHRRCILEGKDLPEKISTLLDKLEAGDGYTYKFGDRKEFPCNPYYIIEDGDNRIKLCLEIAEESITSDAPEEYRKDPFVIVTLIETLKMRQGLGYKTMKELIKQSTDRNYHLYLHGPYNFMSKGLAEKLGMVKADRFGGYYTFCQR